VDRPTASCEIASPPPARRLEERLPGPRTREQKQPSPPESRRRSIHASQPLQRSPSPGHGESGPPPRNRRRPGTRMARCESRPAIHEPPGSTSSPPQHHERVRRRGPRLHCAIAGPARRWRRRVRPCARSAHTPLDQLDVLLRHRPSSISRLTEDQNSAMPGTTGTSTSFGAPEPIAPSSAAWSSSRPDTACDDTP
jgi:hypothetical protein